MALLIANHFLLIIARTLVSLKAVFGMIYLERQLDQATLKQPYRKGAV